MQRNWPLHCDWESGYLVTDISGPLFWPEVWRRQQLIVSPDNLKRSARRFARAGDGPAARVYSAIAAVRMLAAEAVS